MWIGPWDVSLKAAEKRQQMDQYIKPSLRFVLDQKTTDGQNMTKQNTAVLMGPYGNRFLKHLTNINPPQNANHALRTPAENSVAPRKWLSTARDM